jgi:hypothetical protein
MSDLYRHFEYAPSHEHHANLLALARWLVNHRDEIAAAGGMYFGRVDPYIPLPAEVAVGPIVQLPPLGYGPLAGIAPKPGESWPAYRQRAFGIADDNPLLDWVQAAEWEATEPSPVGAALRIAYVMDFGVPWDYAEISRCEHDTDYDTSGFMWDRLDILPTNLTPDGKNFVPLANWPADRWGANRGG